MNWLGPWSNLEKGELMKVVNRSNYRDLMITGDTKGRLRLYKYPCSKEKVNIPILPINGKFHIYMANLYSVPNKQ